MSAEQNRIVFAEPPADFDWAGLEDDKKGITPGEREKMEKAYEAVPMGMAPSAAQGFT